AVATTLSVLHKTPALLDPTRLKDDSGQRKRSQRARAASAPCLKRAPCDFVDSNTRHPAPSAIAAVASREPPSATITSRPRPATAPATSADSVGKSARSLLCVPITTLSMSPCSRRASLTPSPSLSPWPREEKRGGPAPPESDRRAQSRWHFLVATRIRVARLARRPWYHYVLVSFAR